MSKIRCLVSPSTREYQRQVNDAHYVLNSNPYSNRFTKIWHRELSACFNRLFQRDYRKAKVLLQSDYECLQENDIYHIHRRLNSGMQLRKLKQVQFGPNTIAKHFTELQENDIIPFQEEDFAWRELKEPFDMGSCPLYIQGTDRSNSIVHIISNLKENTTSHNTNINRKLLAGLPRNLVGHHLVRMVRLDTELGYYNPIGSTNKLIKLLKAKKDPNTLDGYRYLQIPQVSASISDGVWVQNLSKKLTRPGGAISNVQHGFRRNHGCPTAVAQLFDNVNHNSDRNII